MVRVLHSLQSWCRYLDLLSIWAHFSLFWCGGYLNSSLGRTSYGDDQGLLLLLNLSSKPQPQMWASWCKRSYLKTQILRRITYSACVSSRWEFKFPITIFNPKPFSFIITPAWTRPALDRDGGSVWWLIVMVFRDIFDDNLGPILPPSSRHGRDAPSYTALWATRAASDDTAMHNGKTA